MNGSADLTPVLVLAGVGVAAFLLTRPSQTASGFMAPRTRPRPPLLGQPLPAPPPWLDPRGLPPQAGGPAEGVEPTGQSAIMGLPQPVTRTSSLLCGCP